MRISRVLPRGLFFFFPPLFFFDSRIYISENECGEILTWFADGSRRKNRPKKNYESRFTLLIIEKTCLLTRISRVYDVTRWARIYNIYILASVGGPNVLLFYDPGPTTRFKYPD